MFVNFFASHIQFRQLLDDPIFYAAGMACLYRFCPNIYFRFPSLFSAVGLIVAMMKQHSVENTVTDEARQCTYVVLAPRLLTDGEIYSAIRVEMLRRGGKYPAKGETLVITSPLT
jgi:hypothetical protein